MEMRESANRIVEEHHPVPRNDQVRREAGGRFPCCRVCANELGRRVIARALSRRRDQFLRYIDADHSSIIALAGECQRQFTGAASNIENRTAGQGNQELKQVLGQAGEGAVGQLPARRPGTPHSTLPFAFVGHQRRL